MVSASTENNSAQAMRMMNIFYMTMFHIVNIIDGKSDDVAYWGESWIDDIKSNTVSAVKEFWNWGAENILNKNGYYSSAFLLKHSLEENPSDIYRGNNSRIAWLVNTSDEYLAELDKAIRKSNGRTIKKTIIVYFNPTKPEEYDLYFSIHKANIDLVGYKRDDGKWIIRSVLTDTYDFTELMWLDWDNWENISEIKALGITANDAATISSWGDIIKPYGIEIEFYTTRLRYEENIIEIYWHCYTYNNYVSILCRNCA